MSQIQTSQYLTELITYAKTIGDKSNAPLSAERLIIAMIDLAKRTSTDEKQREQRQTENHLRRLLPDWEGARKALMDHVSGGKSMAFLDDLYMQKMLQAVQTEAEKEGRDELTARDLLLQIAENPSDVLKALFAVTLEEKQEPEESEEAAEETPSSVLSLDEFLKRLAQQQEAAAAAREKSADEEEEAAEAVAEKAAPTAKEEMDALVTDVKRIRQELSGVVFGQDNAINVLVTGYFQARMRAMLDSARTRPQATFLFAGPPGVGKTFLAEQAAKALKRPFMRFDMSEYADKEANIEFCGSDKVYKNGKAGNVTSFVAENPQCVLLFDEIEKAHMTVIHLFLQMLDAGRLRDNYTDEEVSFVDAIIILTTNAGRQLYEDSESGDFSAVSRKVIIKALQKDINPMTGAPYFPGAICSRFASGNVVMFNHVSASFLRTIAKREIQRHGANLKKETGIELKVEEAVYAALLFSEGAAVDARTIRGRAETFFNDELYELLRLIASEKVKTGIADIEQIHISVDTARADAEVQALFAFRQTPKVLVFADEGTVSLCAEKLPAFEVHGTRNLAQAVEILKTKDVNLVLLDMRCGEGSKETASLNVEDVESPARDCYRFLRDSKAGLPVYLLEKRGMLLSEEEKTSFLRQGVRGVLRLNRGRDTFASQMEEIAASIHQQACMERLARGNKLVSFETAQSISANGKNAHIRLFDLKMSVAVDSEDSKSVLSALSRPDVRFEDVIGAKDAKKELAYFVAYLKDPKKYMGTGVKAPKGVLLYGPPGTGKTLLAKAMAGESDMTFIAAEGNQFLKKYVGEGPEKVHELFKTARKYAPSILFIDEIDAIAKERKGASALGGSGEETLTAFLTEMDGFTSDPSKPVFVLAATNFDVEPGGAKSLDPALMRRFDRRVYIELPGKEERICFLRKKMAKNPAYAISEQQIDNIAVRSTGMSLAQLESAMELALRSAIREGSTKVTDSILEEAFETFNNGETKTWEPSQLERVARHEAGHAFLCWHGGETPSYLTIVARGNHGGYMQHGDREGKAIYTKQELLAKIRTSLGGRAAEIVYYGEEEGISTGASGDLATATHLARQIICTYGMDEHFGLAVVSPDAANGAMSGEVRAAVNQILSQQMAEAVRIIAENKAGMDALVDQLMVKNHMNGQEIEDILTRAREASSVTSAQ